MDKQWEMTSAAQTRGRGSWPGGGSRGAVERVLDLRGLQMVKWRTLGGRRGVDKERGRHLK